MSICEHPACNRREGCSLPYCGFNKKHWCQSCAVNDVENYGDTCIECSRDFKCDRCKQHSSKAIMELIDIGKTRERLKQRRDLLPNMSLAARQLCHTCRNMKKRSQMSSANMCIDCAINKAIEYAPILCYKCAAGTTSKCVNCGILPPELGTILCSSCIKSCMSCGNELVPYSNYKGNALCKDCNTKRITDRDSCVDCDGNLDDFGKSPVPGMCQSCYNLKKPDTFYCIECQEKQVSTYNGLCENCATTEPKFRCPVNRDHVRQPGNYLCDGCGFDNNYFI